VSLAIALLKHEQREAVGEMCADFTCRGPRHLDDETTEHGDAYLQAALWADADEAGVTRTWLAIHEGTVAGYVALAANSVSLTRSERKDAALEGATSFRSYGCTQIVMLATRADLQENPDVKIGRALVDHAILVGRRQGEQVGARFLAADVNPPALGFYERCGFVSLRSEQEAAGLIPMVYDLQPRA
jgi:ribosomal protein S18 acetylase RimI-like enzyme